MFGPYEPWKYLVYGGLYFEGHSFVSGGYVLAKEGIGKVCSVPEGMRKVFSAPKWCGEAFKLFLGFA